MTAGLRAKEQELVTGVYAANAVGESAAVDAGVGDSGASDFAAFCAGVPSDNNFSELEFPVFTTSTSTTVRPV